MKRKLLIALALPILGLALVLTRPAVNNDNAGSHSNAGASSEKW